MQAEEVHRAAALKDAQNKAVDFFAEISNGLLRHGVTEKDLSKEIHELGEKRYGVKGHWHKRVVRSGPNTLHPYHENPPDRMIQPDDILFVDLGPIFEQWEADLGRTYVLGNDPVKIRLRDTLEPMWHDVKARFKANPDITGEQLYAIACDAAKEAGWEYGAHMAGHLIGDFPHERIPRDKVHLYITEGNSEKMLIPGKNGFMRHWILEIHLVDRERQIGGFFEQLLTVD